MLRHISVAVLLATIPLAAADVSGRWAGTLEGGGSSVPIYLTLNEHDGKIVGSVATGMNTKSIAIDKAELRDGGLSFEVTDNANRLMRFRLTLTGGVLAGEAIVGTQVSKVAVVQIGGGSGDRVGSGGGVAGSYTAGGPTSNGSGFGSGAASGTGAGGGVFRIAGGISAPVLIHKTEPEYTEEARAAKYQGAVLLYIEVSPDGTATNIRVQRSLGLGLDEKAIEAVKQWKFRPGQKDGKPVTVAATIEVNFRP